MLSSYQLQRSYQLPALARCRWLAFLWFALTYCSHTKVAMRVDPKEPDTSRPLAPLLRDQQWAAGKPIAWQSHIILAAMRNAPIMEGLDCNQDGTLDLLWWKCLQETSSGAKWYYCRKELDIAQNGRIQLAYQYDSNGKLVAIEKDTNADGLVDPMPTANQLWLSNLPQRYLNANLLPSAQGELQLSPKEPWGCHPPPPKMD